MWWAVPGHDPVDVVALRRDLLGPQSRWNVIDAVAETGSTNADLAARARAGEPSGAVLIADHQSSGRGRLGRSWVAPAGSGVALSVLLRPAADDLAHWSWLPLVAGLAVAEATRTLCGLPAMLKWPNDVLVQERKLSGVLAEQVVGPTAGGPACVIGMGINVTLRPEQLPVPTATSLAIAMAAAGSAARLPTRTEVVREVLRELDGLIGLWASGSAATTGLADRYLRRCATLGQAVRVQLADGSAVLGTATEIDATGRLVVQTASGRTVFGAGDVVHLRG